MKVSIRMELKKGKESIDGQMDIFIKVNGLIIVSKVFISFYHY